MTYNEYYNYCKEVAHISDAQNLVDLEINNKLIFESINDYHKKVADITNSILQDTLNWINTDPLYTSYNDIEKNVTAISLGNEFCKILSDHFFGCQIVFDRIECYQNKINDSIEHSSWKWHYDDSAPYRYKIMIYLTDVIAGNGGMKVLLNHHGECVTFKSSRIKLGEKTSPVYAGSRIPYDVIESYKQNGYIETEITGEAGTTLLFHQNIAHKATIPTIASPRLCIIYNFRPYHKLLTDNFFINRSDGQLTGGVKDYFTL